MGRFHRTTLVLLLLAVSGVESAQAHGVWNHVHVTGWAIENLEEGDLRDFFQEPEVFRAAVFGAAFCDSGYAQKAGPLAAAANAYSEYSHWEVFVQAFVDWIQKNDPPPFTSLESKKRVAFLMGVAAHGLQDEIFDTLFLPKVDHHDHGNQDTVDPGSDGFLAEAGLIRFVPDEYIPMDVLLTLYAGVEPAVTETVIEESVTILMDVYLKDTLWPSITESLAAEFGPGLPWTMAHFLDPDVPGSIASEVYPTAAYMDAIWKRLHGQYVADQTAVYWFPDVPRRLMSADPALSGSWVTVVYGAGVARSSAVASWVRDDGQVVDFDTDGTRWGANHGRLHRFMPITTLKPGSEYTVTVAPGLDRIDGVVTAKSVDWTFQVDCEVADDPNCPAQEGVQSPVLDGSYVPPPPAKNAAGGCRTGGHPVPVTTLVLWGLLLLFPLFRRYYRVDNSARTQSN